MLPEDKTPKGKRTRGKKEKTPTPMASGGSGGVGRGRTGTRSDPLACPGPDASADTVMRWLLEVNHSQIENLQTQIQK